MRYKALKAAFPYTLPIFTGFWFLGMAYGIYANASGFSIFISDVHESADLWWFSGICNRRNALKSIRTGTGTDYGSIDPDKASVLCSFYVG